MFEPFSGPVEDLVFCSGHSRRDRDGAESLFSVALIRLRPGGGRDRYESLIRAESLSARDRARSGVGRKPLSQAPPLAEVCREVRAFVGDAPFVFVLDERGGTAPVQGVLGDVRTVDLGFVAEFFLPFLDAHTPAKWWEFVHEKRRRTAAFSPAELVDLSVDLLRHVCGVELNDRLRPWAPALRWQLRRSGTLLGEALVFGAENYSRYFGDLFTPCATEDSGDWRSHLEPPLPRPAAAGKDPSPDPVPVSRIATLFQGLSRALPGYRLRDEQVRYAQTVAGAFNEAEVLTLEAGTGTGKTQGYLIPIFSFLRENPSARAVVSTYTKSLQEQIVGGEIPKTLSAFDHFRGMGVTLLKGKTSYICAEKLDHAYEAEKTGARRLAWIYALVLLFHFRHADLDRVGARVRRRLGGPGGLSRLLGEVSARSGCNPRHSRCPAQLVAADALRARLVVTNHHKLCVLDQDPVLSGRFSICVIDEANHFEAAARSALGIEIRSAEILAQTDSLASGRRDRDGAVGGGIDERVRTVRDLCDEVGRFLRAAVPNARFGEFGVLPSDPTAALDPLGERLLGLQRETAELCRRCQPPDEPGGADRREDRRRRRAAAARARLTEMADALGAAADRLYGDDVVRSFRIRKKDWDLQFLPLDVSEAVRDRIGENHHAVVFTSATLSRAGDFACFRDSVGLTAAGDGDPSPPQRQRYLSLPSPPWFRRSVDIVVPDRAVDGRYANKEAWLRSVSELLPGLIEDHKGRTLVLFASYDDLRAVHRNVREPVDAMGIPLLVQRQGAPTAALCEEFRFVKESVLFGVDTFWYGVDFRGETLTQVIITRMPYPAPSEALQQARRRVLPPDAYWKRYRYDAEIKLRQGIGRLVRGEGDGGRVVVLDRRFPLQRWLDETGIQGT